MKDFKLDLTGVKGFIATILIVLSLIVSVLSAVQGALPPTVETLGTSNFDSITLSGDLKVTGDTSVTGTLTVDGLRQYAYAYWDMDGTNGAMAAHGLPGAPTYPNCMLYTPVYPVTATVYISAANATSVTLAMVNFDGTPYTGSPLAVRCSAVYAP